jgi:hypothetical protein
MGARELIELESEAAEASRELPEPDGVTGRGVKGGAVLSVRLNEEEFAALTERAHAKHIPTSTMARSLILQAMRGDAALGSTVHDAVVTALREVLPKDLLAG